MYNSNIEDEDLPINAIDAFKIGKYYFVIFNPIKSYRVEVTDKKTGDSFFLSNDGKNDFGNESQCRFLIVTWLALQTRIGESIE